MKYFDWDELKNAKILSERGVSFEDVQTAIESGKVLKDEVHPNRLKYPNQKLLIVEINNYAYLVPYVEDEVKIFFKTIVPSRKATKEHLKNQGKEKEQ